MEHIAIQEARTNLSRLVVKAAEGEPFIITRFGRPMVVVSSYVPQSSFASASRRLGFLKGKIKVPDDFDTMGSEEIRQLFEGTE